MAFSSIALKKNFLKASNCPAAAKISQMMFVQLYFNWSSVHLLQIWWWCQNSISAPHQRWHYSIIIVEKWTFFASFSNCENLFCFRSRMEDDRVSDSGVSFPAINKYILQLLNYTITTLTADLSHFRLTNKKPDKFQSKFLF